MRNQNPFASLIGASPFKPLQQHMRIVSECMNEVPKLFDALSEGDSEAITHCKTVIFAKEQKATSVKTELRAHLPKSLFMPVDRRDLLDLLESQHSIVEMAHKIASLLTEREMPVPQEMKTELQSLVGVCMDTYQQTVNIIEEMDELVEVGFRGIEANKVDGMVSEVQELDVKAEVLKSQLNKQLFLLEAQLSPVTVMLWYQLSDWILELSIRAEKTSDRVRLMLAR